MWEFLRVVACGLVGHRFREVSRGRVTGAADAVIAIVECGRCGELDWRLARLDTD